MEFSYNYISRLSNIIRDRENNFQSSILSIRLGEGVFPKGIIVNVEPKEVEIPIIACGSIEPILIKLMRHTDSNGDNDSRIKKVIIPLYNNSREIGKRTFDSFIMQAFRNVSYNDRLQKIITPKDGEYYGGRGIILDKDFNPLFMITRVMKKAPFDERELHYKRLICHVSPNVFLNPTTLVNRGIIKKLIPFFTSVSINSPYSYYISNSEVEDLKAKVIVDNFDNFFTTPVKPSPSTFSNEAINQCLIDNIDDVISIYDEYHSI